jgi:hypothetical protein
MHPASTGTPPPGTIVFVRPPSACDTSDHARVVDSEGRFVGALGPGTWFTAPNLPGEQVFYVWPGMDLRLDMHPEFHPVDVIRIRSDADKPIYVGVRVREMQKLHCWKYAVFHFTRPAEEEVSQWLQNARELSPDRAEGDALLNRDAEVTQAYLGMGREKKVHREEKKE